jgi:membrane protein required for colicin V production
MQTIDIIIIIPLLYGAFKGYRRGFIIEIVSIAAFVISVLVAFKFLNESTGLVSKYITNPLTVRLIPYISFAVLFLPIVFLINKLGWLLRSSTKASLLGSFDSIIGATVGLLTWAFGVSIVFWLVSSVGIKISENQTDKSIIYPYITPVAPKIISLATDIYQKTDFKTPLKKFSGKEEE